MYLRFFWNIYFRMSTILERMSSCNLVSINHFNVKSDITILNLSNTVWHLFNHLRGVYLVGSNYFTTSSDRKKNSNIFSIFSNYENVSFQLHGFNSRYWIHRLSEPTKLRVGLVIRRYYASKWLLIGSMMQLPNQLLETMELDINGSFGDSLHMINTFVQSRAGYNIWFIHNYNSAH